MSDRQIRRLWAGALLLAMVAIVVAFLEHEGADGPFWSWWSSEGADDGAFSHEPPPLHLTTGGRPAPGVVEEQGDLTAEPLAEEQRSTPEDASNSQGDAVAERAPRRVSRETLAVKGAVLGSARMGDALERASSRKDAVPDAPLPSPTEAERASAVDMDMGGLRSRQPGPPGGDQVASIDRPSRGDKSLRPPGLGRSPGGSGALPETFRPSVGSRRELGRPAPMSEEDFSSAIDAWRAPKACGLEVGPGPPATIEMRFTISRAGRVSEAKAHDVEGGRESAFAACLERRTSTLRFPKLSQRVEEKATFVF